MSTVPAITKLVMRSLATVRPVAVATTSPDAVIAPPRPARLTLPATLTSKSGSDGSAVLVRVRANSPSETCTPAPSGTPTNTDTPRAVICRISAPMAGSELRFAVTANSPASSNASTMSIVVSPVILTYSSPASSSMVSSFGRVKVSGAAVKNDLRSRRISAESTMPSTPMSSARPDKLATRPSLLSTSRPAPPENFTPTNGLATSPAIPTPKLADTLLAVMETSLPAASKANEPLSF